MNEFSRKLKKELINAELIEDDNKVLYATYTITPNRNMRRFGRYNFEVGLVCGQGIGRYNCTFDDPIVYDSVRFDNDVDLALNLSKKAIGIE